MLREDEFGAFASPSGPAAEAIEPAFPRQPSLHSPAASRSPLLTACRPSSRDKMETACRGGFFCAGLNEFDLTYVHKKFSDSCFRAVNLHFFRPDVSPDTGSDRASHVALFVNVSVVKGKVFQTKWTCTRHEATFLCKLGSRNTNVNIFLDVAWAEVILMDLLTCS